MAETKLSWVEVLSLALMFMRGRPHKTTGLSPYEILTGRPMHMTNTPFPQNRLTLTGLDDDMLRYCCALNNALKLIFPKVKADLPEPASAQLHDIQPGDWVVVKDLRRKHWHQPQWTGPYQLRGTRGFMHPSANRFPVMPPLKKRRPNLGGIDENFYCKILAAVFIIGLVNTVVVIQSWSSSQRQHDSFSYKSKSVQQKEPPRAQEDRGQK